jgi:hypothetical protein
MDGIFGAFRAPIEVTIVTLKIRLILPGFQGIFLADAAHP